MPSDQRLLVLSMGSRVILREPLSMTKGNASTNIQWMGVQLIIFERLATTKRVVHQRKLAAHTPPATLFVATKTAMKRFPSPVPQHFLREF